MLLLLVVLLMLLLVLLLLLLLLVLVLVVVMVKLLMVVLAVFGVVVVEVLEVLVLVVFVVSPLLLRPFASPFLWYGASHLDLFKATSIMCDRQRLNLSARVVIPVRRGCRGGRPPTCQGLRGKGKIGR